MYVSNNVFIVVKVGSLTKHMNVRYLVNKPLQAAGMSEDNARGAGRLPKK